MTGLVNTVLSSGQDLVNVIKGVADLAIRPEATE